MSQLQETLKAIQLRASVVMGRQLTHGELAKVAKVSQRSLGEWMRGGSAPQGMSAVFNLLALLSEAQVQEVLKPWRATKGSSK